MKRLKIIIIILLLLIVCLLAKNTQHHFQIIEKEIKTRKFEISIPDWRNEWAMGSLQWIILKIWCTIYMHIQCDS